MSLKLGKGLEPDWYVPKEERGKPDPFRVLLAPVSRAVLLEIGFGLHGGGGAKARSQAFETACVNAIGAWENLRDANGDPIAFDPSLVMQLPIRLLTEIGQEVWMRNILAEEEEKNSASPSGSSTTSKPGPADDAGAGEVQTASGAIPSPANGQSRPSA